MDGVLAMDGQGPAGGNPFKANILLASAHPVALDYAFCKLAGISPETVSVLKHCKPLRFGPSSYDQIDFRSSINTPKSLSGFSLPPKPISDSLPQFFINFLKTFVWAGPSLKDLHCIECQRCKKICPADAIQLNPKATFDKEKCISCFCCMEVCPVDAIEMKASPLLAIALKLRDWKKRSKGKRK
jgi:ferredoxin